MGVKLVVKDRGWGNFVELVQHLRDRAAHVKVGVLDQGGGSEVRDGGLTNAQLAAVHEFGSSDGRVPERSFMRSTFNANRTKYVEDLGELLKQVAAGESTVERAFAVMGARIATDIKLRVTTGEGIPPPNAPATVARKVRREARKVRRATASAGKSASRLARGRTTQERHNRAVERLSKATAQLVTAMEQVRPLVDTGRMIGSVTWAVESGRS